MRGVIPPVAACGQPRIERLLAGADLKERLLPETAVKRFGLCNLAVADITNSRGRGRDPLPAARAFADPPGTKRMNRLARPGGIKGVKPVLKLPRGHAQSPNSAV